MDKGMGVMGRVDLRVDAMSIPKDTQVRESSRYLRTQGYDIPAMRAQESKFLVAYAEELKRIKAVP